MFLFYLSTLFSVANQSRLFVTLFFSSRMRAIYNHIIYDTHYLM